MLKESGALVALLAWSLEPALPFLMGGSSLEDRQPTQWTVGPAGGEAVEAPASVTFLVAETQGLAPAASRRGGLFCPQVGVSAGGHRERTI